MDKSRPLEISQQALFRYQAVCAVQVRMLGGMGLSQAVREVAGQRFPDWRNQARSVSERSLYRWLDAYEREGLQGLEPQPRLRVAGAAQSPFDSQALDAVYEITRGNLRAIDDLARKSLELAAQKGIPAVDPAVVAAARQNLLL
jgi:putative transposase